MDKKNQIQESTAHNITSNDLNYSSNNSLVLNQIKNNLEQAENELAQEIMYEKNESNFVKELNKSNPINCSSQLNLNQNLADNITISNTVDNKFSPSSSSANESEYINLPSQSSYIPSELINNSSCITGDTLSIGFSSASSSTTNTSSNNTNTTTHEFFGESNSTTIANPVKTNEKNNQVVMENSKCLAVDTNNNKLNDKNNNENINNTNNTNDDCSKADFDCLCNNNEQQDTNSDVYILNDRRNQEKPFNSNRYQNK